MRLRDANVPAGSKSSSCQPVALVNSCKAKECRYKIGKLTFWHCLKCEMPGPGLQAFWVLYWASWAGGCLSGQSLPRTGHRTFESTFNVFASTFTGPSLPSASARCRCTYSGTSSKLEQRQLAPRNIRRCHICDLPVTDRLPQTEPVVHLAARKVGQQRWRSDCKERVAIPIFV